MFTSIVNTSILQYGNTSIRQYFNTSILQYFNAWLKKGFGKESQKNNVVYLNVVILVNPFPFLVYERI